MDSENMSEVFGRTVTAKGFVVRRVIQVRNPNYKRIQYNVVHKR